ncbi:hypothetical protein T12_14925 [Trichinella patagoniensis]|uniref:Uncharacterized protein n=1 Tax=Trichinella patagoniensis TaxID=990121 RepID=A0A0V0XR85_9BILA|nr:hypothetical protein T12_14925 [Trichinella patagoniensis]
MLSYVVCPKEYTLTAKSFFLPQLRLLLCFLFL